MVNRGWRHQELAAMGEDEFLFWLDHQNEFERLKNEALEEALEG